MAFITLFSILVTQQAKCFCISVLSIHLTMLSNTCTPHEPALRNVSTTGSMYFISLLALSHCRSTGCTNLT